MAASSHRLAAAVASRLAAVAPVPLTVRAEGEVVSVYGTTESSKSLGGSAAATIVEELDDRTIAEKIEAAVHAMLSGVQDVVTEVSRQPWPRAERGGMALPNVRSDGTRVHLWYGDDERAPVIRFPPIAIAEVE